MAEYIDREKIAAEARELSTHLLNEWDTIGVLALIDRQPAADVAPVRHGRWIKDDETGEPICSVCHSGKPTGAVCSSAIEHKLKNYEIRYCYYCGAKMDESEDEDDV